MTTNTRKEETPQVLSIHFQPAYPKRLKAIVPFIRKDWIKVVKQIKGSYWHTEGKYWSFPYVRQSLELLHKQVGSQFLSFDFQVDINSVPAFYHSPQRTGTKKQRKKKEAKPFIPLGKPQETALIALEQQLRLCRYSYNTIKSYKSLFCAFLQHYSAVEPKTITKEQIIQYLLHLIKTKNIAESTQNQVINAIKF